MSLPDVPPTGGGGPWPDPPPPAGEGSASPAPLRALLVDDEAVIRQAIRRYLQRQGWVVDEAGDGAEALRFLLGGARGDGPSGSGGPSVAPPGYDLVLCDLRMPGVSGMQLYARLARERPALLPRLVFTTGDPVSDGAGAFLHETGCAVLPKPFELAELRAHMERVRNRG